MKVESVFGSVIESDDVADIEYIYYSKTEREKWGAYRYTDPIYYKVKLYLSNGQTASVFAGLRKKEFVPLITEVCEKMANKTIPFSVNVFKTLKSACYDSGFSQFDRIYEEYVNKLDDTCKLLLEID